MERSQKSNFWQNHIDQYSQSSLSQTEYCSAHNISLSTFGYWKRKLKQEERVHTVFYPLSIPTVQASNDNNPKRSGLTLHLKGGRFSLEFEEEFSSSTLSQIVSALETL